jgi:hypothetical protein
VAFRIITVGEDANTKDMITTTDMSVAVDEMSRAVIDIPKILRELHLLRKFVGESSISDLYEQYKETYDVPTIETPEIDIRDEFEKTDALLEDFIYNFTETDYDFNRKSNFALGRSEEKFQMNFEDNEFLPRRSR